MVWILARKEFAAALLTYRFGVGLLVAVIGVAAGTLSVVQDYGSRREAYMRAVEEYHDDVLKKEGTLASLVYDLRAFRAPRQLAVFSVGSDRWQGNDVTVTHHHVPGQAARLGTANPYMVLFRSIDVSLIVQVVIGLLALLFAHDAVSGEHEEGTLRLVLANSVARDQVLLGKAVGHLGLLSLIVMTCFTLATVLVQLSPTLDLSSGELARIAVLLVVSMLYVATMYCAGLLLSTCTRRSATALVVAVIGWMLGVAAYPNAVSFVVDAWSPVRAEVESAGATEEQIVESFQTWLRQRTQDVYGQEWHPKTGGSMSTHSWLSPRGYFEGRFMTEEVAAEYRERDRERGRPIDDYEVQSPEEVDRVVADSRPYFMEVEQRRIATADRIWREAWEPLEERMRAAHATAVGLAVASPAAAYRQAVSILVQTDRQDYWRFLEDARHYRQELIAFYEQEGWFSRREWFNDQEAVGSLAHLPMFQEREESIATGLTQAALPLAVMGGLCLAFFMGAYWRFRRYDLAE